jgi:hypothetical protein
MNWYADIEAIVEKVSDVISGTRVKEMLLSRRKKATVRVQAPGTYSLSRFSTKVSTLVKPCDLAGEPRDTGSEGASWHHACIVYGYIWHIRTSIPCAQVHVASTYLPTSRQPFAGSSP